MDMIKDRIEMQSVAYFIFALCKFVHLNPQRAYYDLLVHLFTTMDHRETVIDALLDIMKDPSFQEHIAVVRGAVFFTVCIHCIVNVLLIDC
jgi:hypothetical protein